MSKEARKNVAKRINKATAGKAGKVIGVISYWGLEGVWVKVKKLEQLFQKYDLDMKWFPPRIQGSTAFRKALRQARQDHKGFILRPITEDEAKIVWGVVKEEVDEVGLDLAYECEAKVAFDKGTETVRATGQRGGEAQALAEKVRDYYTELTETFVSWDLQRMLRRNIGRDMNSVTLRRQGGFYFNAPQWLPEIEKHQKIVEEIGDSDMGILVISEDDKHNKRTIGTDAKRSLQEEVAAIQQELVEFQAKGNTKEATLHRRLTEYKRLKDKAQMFAGMLDIQVKDLAQSITDAEAVVKGMLGQAPETKATRPAKKAAKADLKAKAKVRRMKKVAAG